MASLLLWSVGLFIAGGAVWILIGALTPVMMNTESGRSTLLFSDAQDNKTFGAPPKQVLEDERNVATLRTALLNVIAGFLVVAGIMVVCIAWFAWRSNAAWGFWSLSTVAVLALPFWILAARPFMDAGASIGFFDIPPFMWVTTALWLPAVVLGGSLLQG